MKKYSCFYAFSLFFSSFLLAQTDLIIKDASSNTLLKINDEGTAGSITFLQLNSIEVPSNKLYNLGGTLFWENIALGSSGSAGGWTDGGTNIYNSTISDRIGMGAISPSAKLHLITIRAALCFLKVMLTKMPDLESWKRQQLNGTFSIMELLSS